MASADPMIHVRIPEPLRDRLDVCMARYGLTQRGAVVLLLTLGLDAFDQVSTQVVAEITAGDVT